MIINWIAAKALPYLSMDDAELDELSVNFDFALSAEIMAMLYTQNATCPPADVAGAVGIMHWALDEHELALA
ncbi:MAG: hypothetical protein Q8Q50_02510 [Methylobacter sp.]|nr:hypothetical protein [Methylobacter sp.]